MEIFHSFSTMFSSNNYVQDEIVFVPTMGNIHDGHISLVKKGKEYSSNILLSIYLNEEQFNDRKDFENYPRTKEEDLQKLEDTGVKYVVLPEKQEIYNLSSPFNKDLEPNLLTKILCGKNRPGHFVAVMDIVGRFFQIIEPTYAIFGEKDYQQLLVIKELVKLCGYNPNIIHSEPIRDHNGLVLSSRNSNLSDDEKIQAKKVYESLLHAKDLYSKKKDLTVIIKEIFAFFSSCNNIDLEYFDILNANTLRDRVGNDLIALLAVRIGEVRLIDNIRF